jgi:Family of unknown function (DUF6029)
MNTLLLAQNDKPDLGTIHGSLQSDGQYTFKDSIIGAEARKEKILSNTYLQLLYKKGKFETGVRFEMYQTPMLGFDSRYEGQGMPYRYARYQGEVLDVTVGNFYEQFGRGSIFRTYQEWTLGIDNSIDGLRAKFKPKKGIVLTGILGTQRAYWTRSRGIIRAADLDVNLNYLIKSMNTSNHKILLGGSVVSKFQKDDDPLYNLPENTAAFSGRLGYNYKKFHFDTELATKTQDPDATNKFTYNPGNFAYMNMSYSRKGFAISATGKRVDNMDFRSDRLAKINAQTLSFLPPVTKTHTYRLPTLYPYATQLNGELGGQINLYYKIQEGTKIGGKHGLQFAVNYSRVVALDTTQQKIVQNINGVDSVLDKGHTYTSKFIGSKNAFLFEDFNFEISKQWTEAFSQTLTYIYLVYNKDIVQFSSPNVEYGTIYSHIGVLESAYQINDEISLRTELQHMFINGKNQHRDMGNWAMALAELSISPTWYFTVFDEWNYGNPTKSLRAHYYSGQVAYVKGANRLAVGYGRQRAGLLCVGGICRIVPASNGFSISITSSF